MHANMILLISPINATKVLSSRGWNICVTLFRQQCDTQYNEMDIDVILSRHATHAKGGLYDSAYLVSIHPRV